jgi:hypothetical protein
MNCQHSDDIFGLSTAWSYGHQVKLQKKLSVCQNNDEGKWEINNNNNKVF